MAGEWATLPLGDVAAVRSGYAFKSSDWTKSGIPVVKIANVKGGRLEMEGCSFVDEAVASGAGDFRLSDGDILIAMTGYVGDVARVRKTDLPCVLNQRVGKFTVLNSERLDANYLFQFLASAETRQTIAGLGYGSAQPNVSPSLIHKVEIPLPPLPEQKRIAHILGTLDDKIELNRRMNATLEGISRAIFKSWFVDFDPVRQKAAGKQPVGMDAQTAALFPDSFEDSEIGEVPKGWAVTPVSELAEIVGGSTPRTKESRFWEDGRHWWATPKDLSHLVTPVLLATERRITDDGVRQITSGLLPTGTVLLSSRAPIGYLAVAEVPVAINQGFIAMKPKQGVSNLFLLRWTESSHDEILSRANGSTFLEISKANFRPMPVARPSQHAMDAFHKRVLPLYREVVNREQESRTLAALRDTVLPKLLSGEIRVTEAEEATEEILG